MKPKGALLKRLALTLALILTPAITHANDEACIKKADQALAKAAQALGLGMGVAHLGGSEITKRTKDQYGNLVLTVGGGILGSDASDGYLSGTGAVVEMIKTKTGCEVSSVSISTGADYVAGNSAR